LISLINKDEETSSEPEAALQGVDNLMAIAALNNTSKETSSEPEAALQGINNLLAMAALNSTSKEKESKEVETVGNSDENVNNAPPPATKDRHNNNKRITKLKDESTNTKRINSIFEFANSKKDDVGEPSLVSYKNKKLNGFLDFAEPFNAMTSTFEINPSSDFETEDDDDSDVLSNASSVIKGIQEQTEAQVINSEFDNKEIKEHSEKELVKELEKSNLEHNKSIKPIMMDREIPELPISNDKQKLEIATSDLSVDEDTPMSAPVEPSQQNDNMFIPRSVSANKSKPESAQDTIDEVTRKTSYILRQLSRLNNGEITRELSKGSIREFENLHRSICSINSISELVALVTLDLLLISLLMNRMELKEHPQQTKKKK